MLEAHHTSAPTDLSRDEVSDALSTADKNIIKATDFFVEFVAEQTEQDHNCEPALGFVLVSHTCTSMTQGR